MQKNKKVRTQKIDSNLLFLGFYYNVAFTLKILLKNGKGEFKLLLLRVCFYISIYRFLLFCHGLKIRSSRKNTIPIPAVTGIHHISIFFSAAIHEIAIKKNAIGKNVFLIIRITYSNTVCSSIVVFRESSAF